MTKFDRLMQNDLSMTINRSKSKPEAQFQYGGRPFSETGSSLILAVDWDISSKFGKQIEIHLLKRLPLRNLNPEVDFRFYGRHLEKGIFSQLFYTCGQTDGIFRKIFTKDVSLVKEVPLNLGSHADPLCGCLSTPCAPNRKINSHAYYLGL